MDTSTTEIPAGTRVRENNDFLVYRTGTLYSYETAYRTRWAVVRWDGKSFTDRENPARIRPIAGAA